MNSAKNLFEAFSKMKVLVIGDMMVDSYVWGNVSRMSPEAPVPVVLIEKRERRLGGAANVALNIQALGATPIPCAVIGEDTGGDFFMNRLAERNIPKDGIVLSADRETTVKERVLSDDKHVLRVDSETNRQISASELNQLIGRIDNLLPECDVVIFQDYDKGVLGTELINHVVKEAARFSVPTVVDPKKRNFLSYESVTLFKPNLKELNEGLNIEVDPTREESLASGVDRLKQTLNAERVMVTLSEHGVFIQDDSEAHQISAHERDIVDVSGAGDTVISIAALALAAGLSSKQVAEVSNLGGGLVCEHVGVVPIDSESLGSEIERLKIL